jgi:hypothetical protein
LSKISLTPAGTPATEPPGLPATGDGRLAAGAPTGCETECQQHRLDFDHVDPGALAAAGHDLAAPPAPGSVTAIAVDVGAAVVVIGYLSGRAEPPEAGPAKAPATMIHLTVNPPGRSRKVTATFQALVPDRRFFTAEFLIFYWSDYVQIFQF